MNDPRDDPRGLIPSSTEGDILKTTGGVAAWGPLVLPTPDLPLVAVVNGVPGLVFDNAGHIVYTKGTS